jgi:hypothetical protein
MTGVEELIDEPLRFASEERIGGLIILVTGGAACGDFILAGDYEV